MGEQGLCRARAYRILHHAGNLMIPHFGPLEKDSPRAGGAKAGDLTPGYAQHYLAAAVDAATGRIKWKTEKTQIAAAHYQVALIQDGRFHIVGQDGFALSAKDGSSLFRYGFAPYDGCGDPRGTPRWLFYTMSFCQFADEPIYTPANAKPGRTSKSHYRINNRGMARSTCDTGVFPAYGSVYTSPSLCGCNDYLTGYNAFAKASAISPIPDDRRLQPGPAAGSEAAPKSWPAKGDWPIFMGSQARGSSVAGEGPVRPTEKWRTPVLAKWPEGIIGTDWQNDEKGEGTVTPPTVADGLAFVALRHQHRVVALDAGNGKEVWRFTAGGRIDSPPTLYGGLCIFGSRDGNIYALRAKDGALAWTFLAARADRRMIDESHLESSWPVSGSVLIQDGALFAMAGRHSSIDGGLTLWKLDPLTGKILGRSGVDTNPEKMEATNRTNYGGNRRGADLLLGDGKNVFHRRESIDPDLKTPFVEPAASIDPSQTVSDRPFLFDRQYFLSSRRNSLGRYFTPSLTYPSVDKQPIQAPLMVLSSDTLFVLADRGQIEAHKLADDGRAHSASTWKIDLKSPPDAAVLAGGRLYVATSKPDLVVVNPADGTIASTTPLPARIHRRGLAVSGGRLFATATDGTVMCLGERE